MRQHQWSSRSSTWLVCRCFLEGKYVFAELLRRAYANLIRTHCKSHVLIRSCRVRLYGMESTNLHKIHTKWQKQLVCASRMSAKSENFTCTSEYRAKDRLILRKQPTSIRWAENAGMWVLFDPLKPLQNEKVYILRLRCFLKRIQSRQNFQVLNLQLCQNLPSMT